MPMDGMIQGSATEPEISWVYSLLLLKQAHTDTEGECTGRLKRSDTSAIRGIIKWKLDPWIRVGLPIKHTPHWAYTGQTGVSKFPEPLAAVPLTFKASISWQWCWKQSCPSLPWPLPTPLGCPVPKPPCQLPSQIYCKAAQPFALTKEASEGRHGWGLKRLLSRQSWLETLSRWSQTTAKILREVYEPFYHRKQKFFGLLQKAVAPATPSPTRRLKPVARAYLHI